MFSLLFYRFSHLSCLWYMDILNRRPYMLFWRHSSVFEFYVRLTLHAMIFSLTCVHCFLGLQYAIWCFLWSRTYLRELLIIKVRKVQFGDHFQFHLLISCFVFFQMEFRQQVLLDFYAESVEWWLNIILYTPLVLVLSFEWAVNLCYCDSYQAEVFLQRGFRQEVLLDVGWT